MLVTSSGFVYLKMCLYTCIRIQMDHITDQALANRRSYIDELLLGDSVEIIKRKTQMIVDLGNKTKAYGRDITESIQSLVLKTERARLEHDEYVLSRIRKSVIADINILLTTLMQQSNKSKAFLMETLNAKPDSPSAVEPILENDTSPLVSTLDFLTRVLKNIKVIYDETCVMASMMDGTKGIYDGFLKHAKSIENLRQRNGHICEEPKNKYNQDFLMSERFRNKELVKVTDDQTSVIATLLSRLETQHKA